MSLTAALLIGVASASLQETKTFRSDDLGLMFQYPATWELKKGKYDSSLEFDLANGERAKVQIFRTAFRQEAEKWQELQIEVASQMKRRVVRQWEEQIMGVPLLLTRVEFGQEPAEKGVFIGLLYTATKEKLNFRVNSSKGTEAEAEQAWRSALMTLRTTSGDLPVAEDPTKPLVEPGKTATGQKVATFSADGKVVKPVRTTNSVPLKRLGQQLEVFMANDWTLEEKEDKILMTHEKLQGDVELLISIGNKDQARLYLKQAAAKSFSQFKVVKLRDEPKAKFSKAGSFVYSSLRVGSDSADEQIVDWHIVGAQKSISWHISYNADSEDKYKSDRKLIRDLAQLMAVEIAK